MSTRPSEERGAVAIVVAIVAVLILGAAAFTVDLGMQRVVRTDMQSTADTASLDMARALANGVVPGSSGWTQALSSSISGDSTTLGHADALPAGWDSSTSVCNAKLCAQATPGYLDADSQFTTTPPAGASSYNAVRVTAAAAVDRELGSVFGSGSLPATRTAVAATQSGACYQVGSFALGVATNPSILAAIVGDTAAARVLDSNGLATASVSLLGLAAQLGAVTPEQLLAIPNLTIGSVLTASAAVLTRAGDTSSVNAADQLLQLKTDLGSLASTPTHLGQLLALGQGDTSALDADIDVLDLVTGSAIAANGVNGVSVPGLTLVVPTLGTLTAKLYLTAPPVIGCNGGDATSAEGYIELTGSLGVPLLASLKNVSLTVSLANASETLDLSRQCDPHIMWVSVFDQTLASVRLKANVYALAGLLKLATIDTGAPSTAVAPVSYPLAVPATYATPVTTSDGHIGLSVSNADVTVLGMLDVGALVAGLDPLVQSLGELLTDALLPALGITTAGADLWAVPPTPECGVPHLAG